MKLLALALILIFFGGLAGTYYFWPSEQGQRSAAFNSLLQFVAAFALIGLTFLYVTATMKYVQATQQQVDDQNRPPKFTVIRHYYPQTDPFTTSFVMEIANPSVRTTSVTIKAVHIGQESARELCFEIGGSNTERVTIAARDLTNVIVKATFDRIPIWDTGNQKKETAALVFEEVFHGSLPPLMYQL
jgi:hypothetical protein